jgi:TonB-dependent SusC/RagA subfamily outer membrane receptor
MKKQIYAFIPAVSFILILSLNPFLLNAQSYRLKGQVIDTQRRPLENIMVCVKNSEKDLKMTRSNGKFSLKVHAEDTLLMLSPDDEIFQIELNGREKVVFILRSSGESIVVDENTDQILDEIESERLKNFLISLKPREPEQFYSNIYEMIKHQNPDLEVNEGTGLIYIRGQDNPMENNPALIVVDGVKRGNLEIIDPKDVESIRIIKDGTAGIYGGLAAGGVIEITTKTGRK